MHIISDILHTHYRDKLPSVPRGVGVLLAKLNHYLFKEKKLKKKKRKKIKKEREKKKINNNRVH